MARKSPKSPPPASGRLRESSRYRDFDMGIFPAAEVDAGRLLAAVIGG